MLREEGYSNSAISAIKASDRQVFGPIITLEMKFKVYPSTRNRKRGIERTHRSLAPLSELPNAEKFQQSLSFLLWKCKLVFKRFGEIVSMLLICFLVIVAGFASIEVKYA